MKTTVFKLSYLLRDRVSTNSFYQQNARFGENYVKNMQFNQCLYSYNKSYT